ncbi:MAG: transporter associated domain-containing protein [Steroidobacteraceae bacterium]
MNGAGTGASLALIAALTLVLLAGLVEAAMPVLRARFRPRISTREGPLARLRRRIGSDPRRARRAMTGLRTTLLIALLACIGFAPGAARLPVAVAAAAGLALLFLLLGNGWLRRAGKLGEGAALITAWLVAPFFLLLRPTPATRLAPPRDPAETIADIADALANESAERQRMVEALLDLEQRTVEDVMVPRSEIDGLDGTAAWDEIVARLRQTPHTRMPLYDGDLDRVQGIVHMRLVANELAAGRLTRARLAEIAARREALFVPEGTTLYDQLLRFRRLRRRIAFVVDEYGDLQGLVTLEDILEEVVGEFTTQPAPQAARIERRADGSVVVPGTLALRELNRALGWNLPVDGPRTLSGLIVEQLEAIPEAGARLHVGGHAIEVLQVADNAVRTARMWQAPAAE